MGIRMLLAAAAAAIALAPAAALANLQVNANGFERVVTSSTQGDSCDVQSTTGGTSVICPDGSRGTFVLYQSSGEEPACQLDFWFAGNGSGDQRWRADLSHQNGSASCVLHWVNANTLDLSLQ